MRRRIAPVIALKRIAGETFLLREPGSARLPVCRMVRRARAGAPGITEYFRNG